jgi:hypothetical protein
MDKEKLKLIIRNIELLMDSLKSEVYSDELNPQEYFSSPELDYDEIFEG